MLHTSPKRLNILDCTLRDGGYYTAWDFPAPLVADYIDTLNVLPVSMVELGFVGKPAQSGYFASMTTQKASDFASELTADACVMLDAKDVLSSALSVDKAVAELLAGVLPARINTVRVATHYAQMAKCRDICAALSDRGFRVFLNLMQIDAASASEEERCLSTAQDLPMVDVLYIADSFGSMTPSRVHGLVGTLASNVPMDIGFHGHDNRGYGIVNSQAAVSAGANWVDGTMAGMGRGAGNTASEQLIPLLSGLDGAQDRRLLDHVSEHFAPLKAEHGWGSSPAYQFAGANRIHPTYVQKLREDWKLSDGMIMDHLARLRAEWRMRFAGDRLTLLMTQSAA